MRILKAIAAVLVGVAALLVIAVVAVWLLVNPNDYKDRIVRAVKTSTGRELALPGAIKLSAFPWVALEFGPASLGNPAGFPAGEFLSVRHVALRVRLLPLLHKQLQIGRIEIDHLDLQLQKNAAGKGNWRDFGQHDSAATGAADGATSQTHSIFESLAGVVVTNSQVSYEGFAVSDLNLTVGNLAQKSSLPLKLSFDLDRGPDASTIAVSASLMISVDMGAQHYGLANLDIAGEVKPRSGTAALPFRFTAQSADLDLAAQTLRAPAMGAQYAAAKLSGSLNGDQILDQPAFSGGVTLEPVALRALLTQLGVTLPQTRDRGAFASLGFKGDFRYADKSLQLRNLSAQLDDSHLNGSVTVSNFDTRETTFELNLDRIDFDRYRAPASNAPAPKSPDQPAAPLPASPLKSLLVQGTFGMGQAKFSGITLSDITMTLQARDGLVHLSPVKANLYGGKYSGDITYDVRGAVPEFQLNQQLTDVDMSPLLKDAANSQRLSGHGNASTMLAGHGSDSDAMLQSLSGHVELSLANGAIEGADLSYEIGVAQALLKQQALPAGTNTRHTRFDALKMSAAITNGVARTDDLIAATTYLRITGQGTTNLVSKALDLHLVASTPLTLAAIPVSVTGSADDPKVRPDMQNLVKSQLKQKAQDLIKGKLNDQLKGLLGTH
jgi:AsmA protein